MKKIIIRVILCTSLVSIISVGLLVTLILYPQNLFAKKTTYKNFAIYYNEEPANNCRVILNDALALTRNSELWEEGLTFDVFLANNSFYKKIDNKVFGPAIARSVDNNVVLLADVDFKNNVLVAPHNKRNLTKTIAHELVHCLQYHAYGLKFNPIKHPPLWKLEGYPEYISRQQEIQLPTYDLRESINRLKDFERDNKEWVELEPQQYEPIIYYKGRLMIEFLMDIKKLSYHEILTDSVKEEQVYAEMIKWYEKK